MRSLRPHDVAWAAEEEVIVSHLRGCKFKIKASTGLVPSEPMREALLWPLSQLLVVRWQLGRAPACGSWSGSPPSASRGLLGVCLSPWPIGRLL